MQNQEFDSSAYLYGLIAVVILAVLIVVLNCSCIYALFCKRDTKCQCDNDPEKSVQIDDEEVSGLEKNSDDGIKQSNEVHNEPTSINNSTTENVTNMETLKIRTESRSTVDYTKVIADSEKENSSVKSKARTNTEDIESEVENLERLVRKMEVEMLVQKMKEKDTSGSEPSLPLNETHKNSQSTEVSKPTEYKSIPTNVNTGGNIIATVWKESEVAKKMEVPMLVEKVKEKETSESEPTLPSKETHKNSQSTDISNPIEYKSIPTNVNTGGDVIVTVWKESEVAKRHVIN